MTDPERGKLTPEAEKYLREQIAIVRDDKFEAYVRTTLGKHAKPKEDTTDDVVPPVPRDDDAPIGDPPAKDKVRSAYWGILEDE